MSSSLDKSTDGTNSLLTSQTFIYASIAWSILAVFYFLLFSASAGPDDRPHWYLIGTYIFEEVAYLGAALLCFRNWRSPQIVSGRNVWLGFGLGMFFYFLGTLLFGYWELGLQQNPEISLGDMFYMATYICLGWGMIEAVISRKLNLEVWQWGIIGVIAAVGVAFAVWLNINTFAEWFHLQPSTETQKSAVEQVKPNDKKAIAPLKAPALETNKDECPPKAEKKTSGWVKSLEDVLLPLKTPVQLFYTISDVSLLTIATTLLLAFWGGRFALSWRMIAAAAFSFYIADMWFKYANDHICNYESGFLLEVFWVFSGVLFSIGAVLEYDTSSRSSRRGSRKRA